MTNLFAALDPKLRKAMRAELKEMQRRAGITFLFVTHDQEEALSMSDRIAVMNGGKVEQVGTAREVYLQPKSRFVAGFLGAVNWIDNIGIRPECVTVSRNGDGVEASSAAQRLSRQRRAGGSPNRSRRDPGRNIPGRLLRRRGHRKSTLERGG